MITLPPATVQLYARQLHAKHDHIPGAAARIDKAAALVTAGEVTADAGQFFAASSKNDGTGYRMDGNDCPCPDYANGAPHMGAGRWCKHKLAVAMVKRYIRESSQPRIQIGDPGRLTRVPLNKNRTQSTYLYRIEETLTDFSRTTIRLRWSDSLFDFQPATDADYIALARWMRAAPPLPAPRPSIFNEWRKDASAGDAVVMPFLEWQQLYGPMYAGLNN